MGSMTGLTFPSLRVAAALFAALALGACASPTMRLNPDIKPIEFVSAPIPLSIEQIEIARPQRKIAEQNPVDADFVVPLESIARLWPEQRLEARGGQVKAVYSIEEASAISRQAGDEEVIISIVQVRIALVRLDNGQIVTGTGARVESELRLSGSPNMIERQEAFHDVALEIADKLDEQLTAAIAKNFRPFIARDQLAAL